MLIKVTICRSKLGLFLLLCLAASLPNQAHAKSESLGLEVECSSNAHSSSTPLQTLPLKPCSDGVGEFVRYGFADCSGNTWLAEGVYPLNSGNPPKRLRFEGGVNAYQRRQSPGVSICGVWINVINLDDGDRRIGYAAHYYGLGNPGRCIRLKPNGDNFGLVFESNGTQFGCGFRLRRR